MNVSCPKPGASGLEPQLHAGVAAVNRNHDAGNVAGSPGCKEDCSGVQFAFVSIAFSRDHSLGICLEEVEIQSFLGCVVRSGTADLVANKAVHGGDVDDTAELGEDFVNGSFDLGSDGNVALNAKTGGATSNNCNLAGEIEIILQFLFLVLV